MQPAGVDRHRFGVAEHRLAGDCAHRGQDDRTERVDVRDRVQRQPARVLGGAVAEPERHHSVADLVEDDGDDQAPEVDEGLFVDVHEGCAGVRAELATWRRALENVP